MKSTAQQVAPVAKNGQLNAYVSLRSTSMRIIAIFICCLLAVPSFACRCLYKSLESTFADTDVVLEATPQVGTTKDLADRKADSYTSLLNISTHDREVLVTVSKTWKGEIVKPAKIRSNTGTLCGYQFTENEKVIIFASYPRRSNIADESDEHASKVEDLPPYTNYCSGNVVVRNYPYSEKMKSKLDLLQRLSEHPTKADHYSALRKRIREIHVVRRTGTPQKVE